MPRARFVTLTTDIGWAYAAQVKAALAEYVELGRVVDVDHEIPVHGILEAAFVISHVAPRFGPHAVHVVIVDPGVGGRRAPVAIRLLDGSTLVGPDNGVLWPLAQRVGIERAIRLDPRRVIPGRKVHPTFEGRDLFAPAAGRIALGTPLESLGDPWKPARLQLTQPARNRSQVRGTVVHIDRFGNAITNIPTRWVSSSATRVSSRLGGGRWLAARRVSTYETLRRGELGIVGSSFATLELALKEASAAKRRRLSVGSRVTLRVGPEDNRKRGRGAPRKSRR